MMLCCEPEAAFWRRDYHGSLPCVILLLLTKSTSTSSNESSVQFKPYRMIFVGLIDIYRVHPGRNVSNRNDTYRIQREDVA